MSSIFSRIIKGEIPAYKITENENFIAILDAFPLVKGHTLIIPKIETDYLFDLESNNYQGLFLFTHQIAKAIKSAIPCKRVSLHVVGLEVPHAHIHLIPINSTNDCNFSNQKMKFSQEEFELTAKTIANNLDNKL